MIPPVADRFVAGKTAPEAIDHVTQLNDRGVGGIINLLGEHHTNRKTIADDTQIYIGLVRDIDQADLDACISVKPTQLGLDISRSLFTEQLATIVEEAHDRGVFVWIDMEDSGTTTATIDAFAEITKRAPHGVGVCLQANLHRSADDVDELCGLPGRIRWTKGAYREPRDIAYQDMLDVNSAFREHLETLFQRHDAGIAVASHDPMMIDYAKQLHAVHGSDLEFQLLMGVRPDLRDELANDFSVYEYVPYGPRWMSYFGRRVFERTENVKFALRALVGSIPRWTR